MSEGLLKDRLHKYLNEQKGEGNYTKIVIEEDEEDVLSDEELKAMESHCDIKDIQSLNEYYKKRVLMWQEKIEKMQFRINYPLTWRVREYLNSKWLKRNKDE